MDHDKQMAREYARQEAIREAMRKIDEIIFTASDGTEEMTIALTDECAKICLEYALAGDLTPFSDPALVAMDRARNVIRQHPEKDEVVVKYLFATLAQQMVTKTVIPFQSNLLRWEMGNPA